MTKSLTKPHAEPFSTRPATRDDLPFLTRVMVTAATSHLERCVWETLLGLPGEEVSAVLAAVATSEETHWCHVDRFTIAEVERQPVAALSAFDVAREGTPALTRVLLSALTGSDAPSHDLAAILTRAAVLDACTPRDYPDSWGIENVAVVPAFRSRGIVDALISEGLSHGRHRGHEHAQILCLNGNHRARGAWERNGFEIRADYRSRAFAETYGCAGLQLLAQRL